ncbi:MAG: cytochrome c biogenesis protein CcsA, partial [Coriobacteriales bacterium]
MSGLLEVLDPGAHLVAAVLYALAFVLALFSRQTGDVPDRGSKIAGAAGLLVHLTAIAGRWFAVGHGPFVTMYEDLSAYSAVVGAIALYLAMRGDQVARARVPMYPVAFLMLGVALYSGPQTSNLPPTFSGMWLVLHVCFYFLAFGTAVTAGASSVLVLRAASGPADADAASWERFDALAYRYAGLAFAFWGVGMLSGAVWAFNAWGRYWGWD